MKLALEFGDRIPIGVIYRSDRPAFDERLSVLASGPLVGRDVDQATLADIMEEYA